MMECNTKIFHSVYHLAHGLYYTTQWAVLSTLALYFGVAPARAGEMGIIPPKTDPNRSCTRMRGGNGAVGRAGYASLRLHPHARGKWGRMPCGRRRSFVASARAGEMGCRLYGGPAAVGCTRTRGGNGVG